QQGGILFRGIKIGWKNHPYQHLLPIRCLYVPFLDFAQREIAIYLVVNMCQLGKRPFAEIYAENLGSVVHICPGNIKHPADLSDNTRDIELPLCQLLYNWHLPGSPWVVDFKNLNRSVNRSCEVYLSTVMAPYKGIYRSVPMSCQVHLHSLVQHDNIVLVRLITVAPHAQPG